MVSGTISVIIPAFNAADTLVRCLGSVCAQDDADYEVIVIDDGSSDTTAAVCAQFDVVLIQNASQQGPAISRNRGADTARGEFLAFTDADCVPPVDWLRNIRKWLEVAPVVGGTYRPAPWQNSLGRFANLDWHIYWFRFIPAETDSFSMGNVAFRRDVFFDRERLEEHFFHRTAAAEDTILAMTIAERHRILSTDQLWVLHMHRTSLGAYLRKHITTGYSRTLLSIAFPRRKVFSAKDIRLSYVLPQLLCTALLPLAALTGPLGFGIMCALFIALQIPSLLTIRRSEPNLLFLLMSLSLFWVRNMAWIFGVAKALIYLSSRPPEIEAAARWRAAAKSGTSKTSECKGANCGR
jgi:glycosyltransferase involved in cell wall biosynthesis